MIRVLRLLSRDRLWRATLCVRRHIGRNSFHTRFFVCLGVVSGVLACADQSNPTDTPATLSVPVEVETLSYGSIVDELILNGEVEAATDTIVAAGSMGGHVEAVLVHEGERVRSGQQLARVGAALASAQSAQAEAAYRGAKIAFDRVEALSKRELASRASIDAADVRLAAAKGALAAAKAGERDAYIRAPHAGTVAELFVDPGEHAGPGRPVLRLVDLRQVKVVAQLPERDAVRIKVGTPVHLSIGALGDRGKRLESTVHKVGVVGKRYSRTFDIEVMLDNSQASTGAALKPGMMARLSIVRGDLEHVLHVRRDAINESLKGRRVFVVGEEIEAPKRAGGALEEAFLVKAVNVELGPVQGERVAILKGVKEGDRVVIVGQRRLVNGQPVRIVASHGATQARLELDMIDDNDPVPDEALP